MFHRADLLKVEDRKLKFGKGSKGKARKQTKKKQEVIQAFMVSTLSIETITRSSPRCNECRCHCNGAFLVYITPPHRGTAKTESRSCFKCKEVGHIRKDCPKMKGARR